MSESKSRDLCELSYDWLKRESLFQHETFYLDTKLKGLNINNENWTVLGTARVNKKWLK